MAEVEEGLQTLLLETITWSDNIILLSDGFPVVNRRWIRIFSERPGQHWVAMAKTWM